MYTKLKICSDKEWGIGISFSSSWISLSDYFINKELFFDFLNNISKIFVFKVGVITDIALSKIVKNNPITIHPISSSWTDQLY